jgi:hypothetical protein
MPKTLPEPDLADVEVERMPNLDGWELYKAIDGEETRERWTIALSTDRERRVIQYALWTDPKADAIATGELDVRAEKPSRWARAVRAAEKELGQGELDDEARTEVVAAIAERADPTYRTYEDRLAFAIEPVEADEDEHDQYDEEGE